MSMNLFNLDRRGLQDFCRDVLGESSFRGLQLLKWLHQSQCTQPNDMLNLSKSMRQKLSEQATFDLPEMLHRHESQDGTIKWLLQLSSGNCIETVYIPETHRATLCISSQVGCALDCSFCATGKQGFNRNLTTAEIIGQLWLAWHDLKHHTTHRRPISNVVMMGMGEPLLNEKHVFPALNIMLDDDAYGLSKYRVTVSTSGIVPAMLRLKASSPCALAVSLHAPTNAIRDILVPINQKYPLEVLMPVCRDYFSTSSKRCPTYEYVMLDGVNDQPEHARALKSLLSDHRCKLNLIPFNTFPGTSYTCSPLDRIRAFQAQMQSAGIHTTIRKTRGDDVSAACGQLAGVVTDRTRRTSASSHES